MVKNFKDFAYTQEQGKSEYVRYLLVNLLDI